MIYYWMVKCEIARLGIDAVRSLRERTLYSELSASSQWNSKGVKVTTRELQWSHLSCCSIPVWAPGDHSHLDQLRRSPTSCQSACRPHRRTRRWLEEAVWGQKSVIPPRIIPRSDSFLLADSSDCKKSIFIYELFRSYCIHPLKKTAKWRHMLPLYHHQLLLWCRLWYNTYTGMPLKAAIKMYSL